MKLTVATANLGKFIPHPPSTQGFKLLSLFYLHQSDRRGIASNLVTLLNNHLQDSPCIVLSSDMKVRLLEADCYYYPDVTVTCDPRDLETTEDFILYPSLVIEILSKSTEDFDRTTKFADYQTLSSLQEYVLVHQNQLQVECFRLSESNQWQSQVYRLGDEVYFSSFDLTCTISSIYHKVPGIVC